jgi:hypothetical protein
MARDVSRKFDQRCPENTLELEQFALLSNLFQEAVKDQRLDFVSKDDSHGAKVAKHSDSSTQDAIDTQSPPAHQSANSADGT